MYAEILTQISAKAVDQTFTYHIPNEYKNKIKIGIRVKIPFGRIVLEGFVINIKDSSDYQDDKIKDIIELIDDTPVLNKEMLELGTYLSDKILCSKISAYQVMLPKALKAEVNTNIKVKYNRYLRKNKSNKEIDDYINKCKYEKQIEILCKLKEQDILITKVTSTVNTLLKHDLAVIVYEKVNRYKYEGTNNYQKVILTEKQQEVVNSITSSLGKSETFLLYGVTGSGKTEVYMSAIEKVLREHKTAIMLVPEISLTPQIVGKFISRFGNIIAVLHSKLSDTERYDEYQKIKDNKVKIVIGTRSAVFAPLKDIGIIIIDEEHTSSYKQDNHPRYNAKDIAIWRSNYHKCPVVLGSATPTLESFAKAGNKVYKLLTLTSRAKNSTLPNVKIIDMKEEIKKGNYMLSSLLKEKITEKLERKEQIILLLNKRGYSKVISCKECGYVFKCPKCDITYTYHKTSNNLKCHYCGYTIVSPDQCPECNSKSLKDYGYGTEKLEEEIKKKFNAKVIRMDTDTTSKKNSHQKIIDEFLNHNYDILIGTQMIAKGLDFPLVTLVGVISADSTLTAPDFRASENTFDLLSQVSGRAGRSNNPGEVIIQTFNPKHYSIKLASKHDYLSFYKEEMKNRKMLKYSPYYYMVLITITTNDYSLGFDESSKIGKYIKEKISPDTIVLGPTMANMFKINNIYHYQIIIKYRKDEKLKEALNFIDNMYKKNNKVSVELDFDPIRI